MIRRNAGRTARRDRRYQVRAWRRGYRPDSATYVYCRTSPVALAVNAFFAAVLGRQTEVWDMEAGR